VNQGLRYSCGGTGHGRARHLIYRAKRQAVNDHSHRLNFPINVALHPLIYAAIFGLNVWLVLLIWALCRRGVYVGLNLTMITAFFVITLGIPTPA
jgi:hypothetical protein